MKNDSFAKNAQVMYLVFRAKRKGSPAGKKNEKRALHRLYLGASS